MNYIDQINYFWEVYEEESLSSSDAILYFHILNICNKMGWINPFKRRSNIIFSGIRMSKSTFLRSREALKAAKLIEFESAGKGDNNIKYLILSPPYKPQKKVQIKASIEAYIGTLTDTSVDTHNININNKPKTVGEVVVDAALANERHIESENKKMDEVWRDKTPPEEKEKSSAQKEKEWLAWTEMLSSVKLCSYYDNARRLLPDPMDDIRESEFEWFWEQKRDEYMARKLMPAFTEIASHFYYWLDKKITSNKNKIQIRNGSTNPKSAIIKKLDSGGDAWAGGFGSIRS